MTHLPPERRHPALLAIGTAVPPHSASQEAVGNWMASSFPNRPAVQRLIRSLYAYSGIETRYGCTTEYLQPAATSPFAPGRKLEETPTTAERLAIYEREAPPLGVAAARSALARYGALAGANVDGLRDAVTHLVVVSCTGFFAPGLDFVIARDLGLSPSVGRIVIGFMGCSAAFNGLRTAAQIVRADPDARVLVVSVELCSLHIQPGTRRDDLVSASLFADGAAAALVGMPTATDRHYFLLDAFHTDMKPDTQHEMVWQIGDHGFTLRLSPRIPDHLTDVAPAALLAVMAARAPSFWAIHPGGRAIVDGLQELFGLADEAVAASREVLRDFGNLSSATILFVLNRLADKLADGDATLTGVAMAFGPGLTVEMARLTYVPAAFAGDAAADGRTVAADAAPLPLSRG
jgi:predicted naringenin-chalcone synthase